MARTIIDLPDKFHYSMKHVVSVSELNYGMHLGADKILPIALEAQMQFLISLGYDGLTGIEGVPYIMVDSETIYKMESGYGKNIIVEVAASNFSRCSFEFLYRFSDIESNQEIAVVKMGYLFFDYEKRSAITVPEKFKVRFSE